MKVRMKSAICRHHMLNDNTQHRTQALDPFAEHTDTVKLLHVEHTSNQHAALFTYSWTGLSNECANKLGGL